jgi:AcrR family transcriptional regulator
MELKERIIECASRLFFQKGIKSSTMSDVADAAGISKRTLYEAFRDKEELLEVCINEHLKRNDLEIEAIVNSSEDVIDTMMRIYTKHLKEIQNINKSTVHDLKKYHSTLYKKIECRQNEDANAFIPLFQRGIEQGLIREDVNLEIMTWLLKSQFRALTDDNYIPIDKYSPGEIIRIIIINFVRSVATPLGINKIDKIMNGLEA